MNDMARPQKISASTRLKAVLRPGMHKRIANGHPWAYSNEIDMTSELRELKSGTIVALNDTHGRFLGAAMFNPHSLISARILERHPDIDINADWLVGRFSNAMNLRDRLFARPFYRLVHAEADGMPGLIVDRYDESLVVQLNTAGMDLMANDIVRALQRTCSPKGIVVQRQGAARRLEGMEDNPATIIGHVSTTTRVVENGIEFLTDLIGGQKTGWFFDHRENRARVASLAMGKPILDLYSYLGGFGISAAVAGASNVICVDRSHAALNLATRSAEAAGVSGVCKFEVSDAFTAMETLKKNNQRFGIVIADPPAFVKSRKGLKSGLQGYRKLARLSSSLVEPGGVLCIASCSQHVDTALFNSQIYRGLRDAKRNGRILHTGGAGPDHPVHPALPESAYLKCLFLQID